MNNPVWDLNYKKNCLLRVFPRTLFFVLCFKTSRRLPGERKNGVWVYAVLFQISLESMGLNKKSNLRYLE